MRVAIYVRVSTDEQAEHGNSIDVQKDRLIAYCTSQGWNDYKLYIDDGYSGTNIDRPAMSRMIRYIEDKQHDLVLVMKLDRLSRRQKDVLYLLEDVFEKHNVAFRSATEPFDTTTAFGKATIGMLAVFAQLERDMIVERTTSGRRQNIANGNWPGGREPFGYKWNKETKSLEVVEEEAYYVKEIFKKYLQGWSRLAIAEWIAKRSNDRVFDHAVIRDMLSRVTYNGKLTNAGSIVDGNHKAIIDDDTWFAVQKEINRRKEGMTPIGEYLLTGLLACKVCGGNVVHVRRKTKAYGRDYIYELYACRNQHVRQKDRTNHCTMGYIRRTDLEEYVINQIKRITTQPKAIHELVKKKKSESPDHSLLDSVKAKLDKINQGLENLYEAIETGTIKVSAVGARISRLEEEREMIMKQLDELTEATPSFKEPHQVYYVIREIGEAWDFLNEEEQKIMIRKAITKIELKKGEEPVIHWNLLQ